MLTLMSVVMTLILPKKNGHVFVHDTLENWRCRIMAVHVQVWSFVLEVAYYVKL
jgi:hypothetical protein